MTPSPMQLDRARYIRTILAHHDHNQNELGRLLGMRADDDEVRVAMAAVSTGTRRLAPLWRSIRHGRKKRDAALVRNLKNAA